MYNSVGILSKEEKKKVTSAIKKLDETKTRKLLLDRFSDFREAVIDSLAGDEIGAEYIIGQIEKQLNDVYKQLTLWETT